MNTLVFTPLFPCINQNLLFKKSATQKGLNFEQILMRRIQQNARFAKTTNLNMPKSIAVQFFWADSNFNALAKRPVGQAVKTPPFHGGNRSSILPRVTKKRTRHMACSFFCDSKEIEPPP